MPAASQKNALEISFKNCWIKKTKNKKTAGYTCTQ